jgi:hypothetical protein
MTAIRLFAAMDSLDWIAFGFLFLICGGILVGLFLYLRTAYKAGGWKRVGRDFLLAIVVLVAWVLIRIIQRGELNVIKNVFGHLIR